MSRAELLDLIHSASSPDRGGRRQAIACYLSAGEGWDQALKVLRGTFASETADAVKSGPDRQDEDEINQRASEYLQRPVIKTAGIDND